MLFFRKKTWLFLALLGAFLSWSQISAYFSRPTAQNWSGPKFIAVIDNSLHFKTISSASTIGDFLKEKKIILSAEDQVLPTQETILLPGENIVIYRASKIKIQVDSKTVEKWTLQKTVASILTENNIALGRLDKVVPDLNSSPNSDMPIVVTRINIEEKIIPEDIAFKIISNIDKALSWREQKITQAGEKGVREIKYRITYKNNKEVSRVTLERNITQTPVDQIVTQGTYMQLKSPAKGVGTWYAWKGGLFAASTTIPKGSYAKVTNTANGKSVIVQINDYGPQGKGRIIDLDKVAFTKIASIGAGVIGVKVEEVLN